MVTYRFILTLLVPILGSYVAWRYGQTWLPILQTFQVPLIALGAAVGLWLVSRDIVGRWLQGAVRLLGTAGFFVAAAGCLWPLVDLGIQVWTNVAAQAPTRRNPLLQFLHDVGGFQQAYTALIAKYPVWAASCFCCGVGLLLGIVPFSAWAIHRPFAAVLGRTRDAADGPWRGGWIDASRVRQLKANGSGLPLGLKGGAILRYRPDIARGWIGGHHMVVAGTRAGKGVACVLPAIVDHDGPIIVVDVKGENFAVCRRHRTSLGRRQVVLNPFHVIEDRTDHFDPLLYLRPQALQRDIATLVEGLIRPEAARENSWISNGARQLLEAALELVMTELLPEERSLLVAVDLVLAPNRLDTFSAWMNAGNRCGGRIAQTGAKIMQMGDKARGAVLDCLSENLDWLKFDDVRRMLSGSDFQPDDLIDDSVDLYLVVPQDMTGKLGNFMRVMVTLALGTVTRQDGRRVAKKRILAVMDEFTRLGRMEKAMEIATIAAGGGVEAVFVVQDRGTLDAVYGPDDATTLLGSCATTRVFGLGRADDKTARWAENQMPYKTIIRESSDKRAEAVRGNRSEVKERLMDGPTIQEMPAGQMLCLIRGHAPLLVDQIVSHRHPAYRRKLDRNPVFAG
ncbi:type IV secretory system conjugative DNA transfer family protein [Niveispirillum cyanobacteriorum]|uniref:type IV secretory system conjugative DNA transfer family protein n=1 Tax=Niveispirillum cyanobacteriorum TaxID=1612173 RepID=UPI001667828B|nr:type IV secretory system conjugative DNA transfer family protein [Niveispirillum cyanobacteriorum]GGE88996.1 hypothetical protein GCM10011317_52530 [Niveispirillum cyanobacteriorum]